ncbi:nitrogen permease regulator of amino acid transport activity 3-domain-containing protein [Zopfochytrium polystomum]|nr:nitrogen permease regulator of amino acid transport activity 3-domain-containing protein [Zopfochytrium polystomum]
MEFAGILLVCYSSRGHQLVFSYPPSWFDLFQHVVEDPPILAAQLPYNSGSPDLTQAVFAGHLKAAADLPPHLLDSSADLFLGFEPKFLADILSPKVALCDKEFRLSVDDIVFVGQPTLLNADRPGTGHRFARMIQRKRLERIAQSERERDQDLFESRVQPSPAFSDPHDDGCNANTTDLSSSDSDGIFSAANFFSPRAALGEVPVGKDSPSGRKGVVDESDSGVPLPNQPSNGLVLTMFNLVVALRPTRTRKRLDQTVLGMFHEVVAKLTGALKYEQLKRGYVKRETELILAVKDDVINKSLGRGAPKERLSRILQESSLARLFAHLFHTLKCHETSHIIVNSSLDLSLQLPVGTFLKSKNVVKAENLPQLKPFCALLFFQPASEILACLPNDASPLLRRLIETALPTRSLEELSFILDCSIAQIFKLAAHLIFWRRARTISVIRPRNVFVVSKNANFAILPTLESEIATKVGEINLAHFLSVLKTPAPFGSLFRTTDFRGSYLEILETLLRADIIEQLESFVYVCIPHYLISNANYSTGQHNSLVIANPSNMTEAERQCIDQVIESAPETVRELFLKLIPYFDGKHSVEEILYRESLHWKDFKHVLRNFKECILITWG